MHLMQVPEAISARRLAVPAIDGAGALFAGTIGFSAFLLFALEPLMGRLVLPVFGGTPNVWATVLVFFQATLLVGYAYGHVSVTRLGPRRGAVIHVVLALIALAVLVAVGPLRAADLVITGLPPSLDIIVILAITVGPAVFILTATTPLLSAWYTTVRGRDPYWLYALSNGGSLVALLAYPLLVEPRLALSTQRGVWTIAFAGLVGALVVCAWGARGAIAEAIVGSASKTPTGSAVAAAADISGRITAATEPITRARLGRWILWAAVPSGLLLAVTNAVTTDLVAAPLLWVIPLALYLVAFIVAFSPRANSLRGWSFRLAPAAATLLWVPFGSAAGWPVLPLLILLYACFAVVATALHSRLADDRPAPERLTAFYLVISVGGVLGGALVGLVAPAIFPAIWEYPLLVGLALAGLALGAIVVRADGPRRPFAAFVDGAGWRIGPYLVVALALAAILVTSGSNAIESGLRWLLVGGVVLLVGANPRFLAVSTAVVLAIATLVLVPPNMFRDRDYFGVVTVEATADGAEHHVLHGTTIHGRQFVDPARRDVPTSYYARSGPLGSVFRYLDERDGSAVAGAPARSTGAVGLGAGVVAAYLEPGQTMTFFEIDPLMTQVAEDTRYFTFLADAAARTGRPSTITPGDGRLSLLDVPAGAYDLLILDAFSSDTIPAHLLTVEAVADDARTLRPGGLLAFHLSNRYYDMIPAVAASADAVGLHSARIGYVPTPAELESGADPSTWLVASADPAVIDWFIDRGWVVPTPATEPLTDDFPDVLRFLSPGGAGSSTVGG